MTSARDRVVRAVAECRGRPEFLQILARVWMTGLWRDGFVVARAVAFCATSIGDLDLAGALFRSTENPTAFAFNAMIRGHSAGATPSEALLLFRRMLKRGIYPDKFTFPFVLRAVARISPGDLSAAAQYHGLLFKHGLSADLHVQTSLLHVYATLRIMDGARQVFDEMPERGVVAWNAIISAYGKISETPLSGVILFARAVQGELELNDDTLVAALQCCAAAGSLILGKTVHGFILRRRKSRWPIETISTLLRMYVKCGSLHNAEKIFDEMPERDLSAWTAMIGGTAEHGHGAAALVLFERMVSRGLKPDALTFTCLLHGCSHSGLVQEGLKLFESMASAYNVEPGVQHYGAMVDLLVRAGMEEEARRLAASMPLELNSVVRSSLLRATPSELLADEEDEPSVEISNGHARLERWDEVERVRTAMAQKGIKKVPAFSSVDIR